MSNAVALAAFVSRIMVLAGLIAASGACSATPAQPAAAPLAAPAGAGPAGAPESSTATATPAPEAGPAAASSPSGGPAAATGSTIAKVDAREDPHWVQADDYFVTDRAFKQGWLRVHLAKMKEPAKAKDGEALFFVIKDGGEWRSAHFYRTRPAVKADLVLGTLLVCFENNKRGNVYRAPSSKDNARPGRWWLARITDLSDLDKGYATLSGSYHCAPDALRAIVE